MSEDLDEADLGRNVVPEANCGERDEAKVDGLEEAPVFKGAVDSRSARGEGNGGYSQVQHHPVHTRLPVVQARVILVQVIWQGSARNAGSATGTQSAVLHAFLEPPEMEGPQNERQESDNTLQEKIEEEDSSRTAQEAVNDHCGFAGRGLWCCVAVTFK